MSNIKLPSEALKVLIAIGVLYRLNNFLSRRALNNFTRDRSWDWRKEIVVVTGGCSGIGELMVRKFAKNSIKVVALDLNPPKTPFPAKALFYKTDVTSPSAIRETAQQIRQEVGEPTVLINNAGIGHVKPILNETEEQIKRTFDVNIMAHSWLIREFLPYMVQQNHGHIVTIASLASFMAHASNVDYACTKAATLAFHEGLAQELKHVYRAKRVRTTVVHPTWIRTPPVNELLRRKPIDGFMLNADTVADAVVDQVLKGESAQLVLPERYNWVPSIRGFPSWLQQGLRDVQGDLLVGAAA
ncbi:hypothetical protein H2201_003337 [Coniosporium apollinis]|uniref:Uncharacterized protein n=2 Tax=Coniosporium TaxID=2810619 RepID=A0ABQ9NYL7_9PEZI|nr:hypothetical protein H2201_003337 [Coniosporium apollinis]